MAILWGLFATSNICVLKNQHRIKDKTIAIMEKTTLRRNSSRCAPNDILKFSIYDSSVSTVLFTVNPGDRSIFDKLDYLSEL